MRVYINRSPVLGPWGGGNLWTSSMHHLLPEMGFKVVGPQDFPEVVFIAGLGSESGHMSALDVIKYKTLMAEKGMSVRVILRVNENDARKGTTGTDLAICKIAKECDHVVFVSEWLREYFSASNWNVPTSVIYNGVDSNVFCPGEKLSNGKINIVTHHWSDNFMKGFDVYNAIDTWIRTNPGFTFTYIGRDRGSFKNTKVIPPLFEKSLGQELARYDVYVSGSRFDPGPNHIIESIACNIPTYVHKDGGGCVEFAGIDHTYENPEEILNILYEKSYTMNDAWAPSSWKNCISHFASTAQQ